MKTKIKIKMKLLKRRITMRRLPFGLLVVAALFAFAPVSMHGQSPRTTARPAATSAPYKAPRTADGHPDLQGVWGYATITPLERPAEFAAKAVLTPEEVAEFERKTAEIQNRDRRDNKDGGRGSDGRSDLDRAYNEFWWDKGSNVVETRQTSLIIDPPDGRIPALTPDGQKRAVTQRGFQTASAREEGPLGRTFDSYEDRPNGERCLLWTVAGPPMTPGAYNNNVQLVQSRDSVVIVNEMIHEHRVAPLDGRPHLPPAIRQWQGDSRAHWEGDTLVVDTTNFTKKSRFRGSSENLHLIERFTRVSPDSLIYEFTVDDPATFTKSWTARLPMTRNPEPIYEYACHEGNYALPGVLAGARAQEKAAAEGARKGSN
jgi:hypothetical protein